MREEIQRTRSLIASLEGQIEAAATAEARQELRRRLDEARRHSAELQLTLAQKKVEITRQALEFSQKRYDDARLELRKTMNKLRSQYPDLVGAPATPPAD
jgi:predicted  nucleic acid-binding Zn-ribbon protein